MTNKLQEAGLLRVSQITTQLEDYVKSTDMWFGEFEYIHTPVTLEKIELRFEENLTEILELIQKCDLSEDLYRNFVIHATTLIYNEAITRNNLKWAVKFAEKYKL